MGRSSRSYCLGWHLLWKLQKRNWWHLFSFLAGARWNWCRCCLTGRNKLSLISAHCTPLIYHIIMLLINLICVLFELFGSYQQLPKGESQQRMLKMLAGIFCLTVSFLKNLIWILVSICMNIEYCEKQPTGRGWIATRSLRTTS